MRILPVQYNYTNRYSSQIKAESNKQTCAENLQQADGQAPVNFQGLLYFLTKDNRHKVNMDGLDITKKEFCIVGSTGDWDTYLDFDASAHQISGDETFTSYLYKIS